jgi:2-oxoglutarate dehydrogenase E1 component
MSTNTELFEEYGPNSGYIRDLYQLYLTDPNLVGSDWINFFSNHPNLGNNITPITNGNGNYFKEVRPATNYQPIETRISPEQSAVLSKLQVKVYNFINSYRRVGHLAAKINPLEKGVDKIPVPNDLKDEAYQFTSEELENVVDCDGFAGLEQCKLRELIGIVKATYCGSLGFEYMHLTSTEERNWVRERIENRFIKEARVASREVKLSRFAQLTDSEAFESELHKKYVGHKRFSLQGGETTMPVLFSILESSVKLGAKEAFIGMAHRGRLNVLRNIMGKPLADICSEFEDQSIFSVLGSGDVKYHMGYENSYETPAGKIDLTLAPNPSHLEFVYPVVQGMVRAKQDLEHGSDKNSVIPIAIHGDAAFIGQGIVAETLNMAYVSGYNVGGTVHVVINNQVGFTTDPEDSRSSIYCSDFTKAIDALVVHINCDDVDSACWAAELATEFRQKFNRDVVLDIYCYRKYGHNEGDDPSFTQPVTYKELSAKPTTIEIYAKQLESEMVVDNSYLANYLEQYAQSFAKQYAEGKRLQMSTEVCPTLGRIKSKPPVTNVRVETLKEVADSIVNYPSDFTPHPKLTKILEKRVESLTKGGIDWGFAEGLAFGALQKDSVNVRLSGQDCGRGTFSQRHLALSSNDGSGKYYPLQSLKNKGYANFEVVNSTLSESGVMAFEFGYSATAGTNSLVLWEGQFGDFANGAQVIIDQFICSSEQKWSQQSGIVLLLPHGYEGQGPEHSSARLERYLQLCAEGNMVVAHPSTAAQHFHLLRRQGLLNIPRPLIVMTPKSLLRAPEAACQIEDLVEGKFHEVLVNDFGDTANINQLVLCSGKVYYDVAKAITNAKLDNIKVLRLEQLYPFPQGQIALAIQQLKLKKVFWVQEEPRNMGAWSYVEPFLEQSLNLRPTYIGRAVSASTATGSGKRHTAELQGFLNELVSGLKQ